MKLHGMGDQIPIFRMNIGNQVPQLPNFGHSPLHYFVKKEGNEISEINMIKSPVYQKSTDEFI
jgi:predicted Fe-Mo cluster-binding NifX family protein